MKSELSKRVQSLKACELLLMSLAVAICGCGSGTLSVEPPSIDPDGAAAEAMETYDTNGDGFIAGEELDKAPALKAAIDTLDIDDDGKVSAAEIASRIRFWQSTGAGLSAVRCRVTLDGRPLEGAMVTFEPESFLGDEVLAGSDDTNARGIASPSIPKEKRPSADMPRGIQLGLFKVRISKLENGKETIPSKYNSETTLGQQVSRDDPAIVQRRVQFDLKSN